MWGEIYPQGIESVIKHLYEMTELPMYITETGTPDIGDEIRQWYVAQIVHGVWRAINFNYPVKGLYYWSLVDSFEWTAGYNPQFRFGLYAMDFETQERTKRRSGDLYGEICQRGGLTSDMVERYVPNLQETLFPGAGGQARVQRTPDTV